MFRVPAKEVVFSVDTRDFVIFSKQGSFLPTLVSYDVADPEGSDGGRGRGSGRLTLFRKDVEDGV